ncbi:MAG: PQQ-dependent sugar dehydrogenase, partial [Acidimicrobiales bacterium]
RGLLGVAVDAGGRTFAAWTRPDGRLVVGQVAPAPERLAWLGPPSTDLANGGHLVVAPDGRLVIGIGDLRAPPLVDDPGAPNGKLLSLDPDGPPDQSPRVLSRGWNNPFAFTYTPGGQLWVADNAPGRRPERLARGDGGGPPTAVTELAGKSAPSGLAALADGRLALCGFVSRRLDVYRVGGETARRGRRPLAEDCATGAVRLADGRLAYADESSIRVLVATAVAGA